MGKYRSTHTGPQIDTGVDAALNPDIIATENSDSLITSGAVYNGLSDKSAVLANPTLAGTESALDSVEIDGTKFKVGAGDPYTSNPAMDGTASPGSSNDYARGDHVHPKDTSKADKSELTDIFQTGSTCTEANGIAAGVYFYLDGNLVVAKTAIAYGATFTSGTNYETPTAGALNALKSAIPNIITTTVTAPTTTGSGGRVTKYVAAPSGKTIIPLAFFGANKQTGTVYSYGATEASDAYMFMYAGDNGFRLQFNSAGFVNGLGGQTVTLVGMIV